MNVPKIKTAFILGAGLGMRLRPLTKECPKPLLPVGGRPLITFAMDHCLTAGVERFIVNTHHCPAAYDRAFPEKHWRGRPIFFSHEPVLLDTAGGMKNIEHLLAADETLLVYNGDILSDLPLGQLLETHAAGGKEITLVLRSDGPLKNVALDAEGAICDLRMVLGNPGIRLCLFTGIYAVEKRFFRRLTPGKVESIVPVLVEMIRETLGSVGSVMVDEGVWRDIGDPEAYDRVKTSGMKLHYDSEDEWVMMTESPDASCDRISNSTGIRDEACRPAPAREDPPMQKGFAVGRELRDSGKIHEYETFVRTILGLSTVSDMTLVLVGQGGSDRDYFRVTISGRDPFILMRYGRVREENSIYAAVAGFLQGIGVAVPEIFGHDPERGLLLMEDLGDEDLFTNRNAPWELRRRLYEKTLAIVSMLHAFSSESLPARDIRLMPGFSPELYRWERAYFREHCVYKTCGISLTVEEDEALETELGGLARRLLEAPPVLVHRDLQSQNVMVRKGEPVLIDFQGMRFGSLFYDLGSLLYDPYVEIEEADRTALLKIYYDFSRPLQGWDEFESLFHLASAQRLMQALGAYGFLGREQGKSRFLAHIAPALDRLIDVTGRMETLPRLHALARRCRRMPEDGC
jgi:aminoglycoside/choline kinase family phosphotransferase/choline kinase